jgi:transposase
MAMSKKQIKDAKASQNAAEKTASKTQSKNADSGKTKDIQIFPGLRYTAAQKEEAIRTYNEARSRFNSMIATARYTADNLNIGCPETVLAWVKQSNVDLGNRDGLTTKEREELFRLRKEVKEKDRAIDILKKAHALFSQDFNPLSHF